METTITDVRAAKAWVDAQSSSFEELGRRLADIERAYQARTGEFAGVPSQRSNAAAQAIAQAADEPGRELLRETHS